jgi:hypothetical protein
MQLFDSGVKANPYGVPWLGGTHVDILFSASDVGDSIFFRDQQVGND